MARYYVWGASARSAGVITTRRTVGGIIIRRTVDGITMRQSTWWHHRAKNRAMASRAKNRVRVKPPSTCARAKPAQGLSCRGSSMVVVVVVINCSSGEVLRVGRRRTKARGLDAGARKRGRLMRLVWSPPREHDVLWPTMAQLATMRGWRPAAWVNEEPHGHASRLLLWQCQVVI